MEGVVAGCGFRFHDPECDRGLPFTSWNAWLSLLVVALVDLVSTSSLPRLKPRLCQVSGVLHVLLFFPLYVTFRVVIQQVYSKATTDTNASISRVQSCLPQLVPPPSLPLPLSLPQVYLRSTHSAGDKPVPSRERTAPHVMENPPSHAHLPSPPTLSHCRPHTRSPLFSLSLLTFLRPLLRLPPLTPPPPHSATGQETSPTRPDSRHSFQKKAAASSERAISSCQSTSRISQQAAPASISARL